MKSWPTVRLGEVLRHRKEFITIDDLTNYKRPRVQLHVQGIVQRDEVLGALIKTKTQQVCRTGEFLVAEIDAKVGGFGIVPESLNGSIVSSHYFLFVVDESKLDRRFLDFFIRTPTFREQVAAQGSTNYAAIRPAHVLGYEIPLLPLSEQRRVVVRIEELAAQIHEARTLRQEALEETNGIVISKLSMTFDTDEKLLEGWALEPLSQLLVNEKEGITTGPFGTLLQKSDVQDLGVPIFGISNVQANRFVPGFTDYVSEQKAHSLSSYRLQTDDIAVARSGTVGRSCLVPDGLYPLPIMSSNLIRLRANRERFLPRLLCQLLNGSKLVEDHKDTECRGSSRTFFTHKILLKLRIPVPPMAEQRRIVAELDALQSEVDALKRLQAETAAELDALLPAILDRAFKGEL
jgi:type I restriction enzyme, S subunit